MLLLVLKLLLKKKKIIKKREKKDNVISEMWTIPKRVIVLPVYLQLSGVCFYFLTVLCIYSFYEIPIRYTNTRLCYAALQQFWKVNGKKITKKVIGYTVHWQDGLDNVTHLCHYSLLWFHLDVISVFFLADNVVAIYDDSKIRFTAFTYVNSEQCSLIFGHRSAKYITVQVQKKGPSSLVFFSVSSQKQMSREGY